MAKSKEKADCPFWRGPCKEHECRLYIQVQGHNPNTGEQMNKWDCALAWLPILTIENSQQQRATGAAVESFRNEVVKQQTAITKATVLKTLIGKPEND